MAAPVFGMQVEANSYVRSSLTNRKNFASTLANAVRYWLKEFSGNY